jgi:hypothetical protein
MEDDVVVVALVRKVDEVLRCPRRIVAVQLDLDVTEVGGDCGAGHVASCG